MAKKQEKIDLSQFNDLYDTPEFKKELKEAKENKFEEIPEDEYTVKLVKLEIGVSKNKKPNVKGQFKIVEGEFKNKLVFYNQSISSGMGVHMCNEFLRSLNVFDEDEIEFTTIEDYNDLLLDIVEETESNNLEFVIDYTLEEYNGKNYGRIKVLETLD